MPDIVNIVIPVKGLADGKSRLKDTLGEAERYSLNSWLTERTLKITAGVAVPGSLYVVSPDLEVEALARNVDATFIHQHSTGLNEALAEAAATLPSLPTLYLAADLPTVSANDIRMLLELPALAIAPDDAETGTNALRLPKPATLTFQFGNASFEKHLKQAEAAELTVELIRTPGLSYDIDTKDDLIRLEGWP